MKDSKSGLTSGELQMAEMPNLASVILRNLFRSPAGIFGFGLTIIILVCAIFAPVLAPADPLLQNLTRATILQLPNLDHLLGTDPLGRDILSRLFYGARTSLLVAGSSVATAVLLGMVLGSLAATLGGWCDRVTMRLMDSMLAFPLMVLAITISVALGRGPVGAIVAIAVVNLPTFTRLSRAKTLKINQSQFMTAATVMGAGLLWRFVHHIVPNMINTIIVQTSIALAFAVLMESALSFLGLGIQPPAPSLGFMIAEARNFLTLAPHVVFFPAMAIFLIVLGLNLLGDALSDTLDVRKER